MVFPWTILPDYKLWCYSTKLFPEIISMYQLLAKKHLLPESAASKNPCVPPESSWPHMSQDNNISGGCFCCSIVAKLNPDSTTAHYPILVGTYPLFVLNGFGKQLLQSCGSGCCRCVHSSIAWKRWMAIIQRLQILGMWMRGPSKWKRMKCRWCRLYALRSMLMWLVAYSKVGRLKAYHLFIKSYSQEESNNKKHPWELVRTRLQRLREPNKDNNEKT